MYKIKKKKLKKNDIILISLAIIIIDMNIMK